MVSGDPPKRRAAPLPATDSVTDVDDPTDPRANLPTELDGFVERTIVSPVPQEDARSYSAYRPQKQIKRRDDTTAWPDEMPPRTERPRRALPRMTDDDPDVVGAPERTVIAPLPPQEESVEPVPMPRTAIRSSDARRDEARGETGVDDWPIRKNRRYNGRERRLEQDAQSAGRENSRSNRRPASDRRPDSGRDLERHRPHSDEPDQAFVRQNDQIDHSADSPWRRLRLAVRDVWVFSVLAAKHHWGVLRTQGLKPYIEASRPYVQRVVAFTRHWAFRAKVIAVRGAARVGLVKPRRLEYELESSDRVDRAGADAWPASTTAAKARPTSKTTSSSAADRAPPRDPRRNDALNRHSPV